MEIKDTKCSMCRCYKYREDFMKNGRILKTCFKCREYSRKNKIINKCPHGKEKCYCRYCDGSSVCIHKKRKLYCRLCEDPVKVSIRCWISNSRQSDKKYNRYDADRFIDKCFLEGLIEDSAGVCHYCEKKIQYLEYNDDLASIERLDNKVGHVKSNCVIACRQCNFKRQKV